MQVDDKSASMHYKGKWSVQNGSPSCLYKGSFHYAEGKGKNRASLEFVGTRAKVWFVQFSTMGTAKVLIDGHNAGSINMHGGSNPTCKSWLSDVLPLGTHTVEIRGINGAGRVSLDVITTYP